MTTDLERDSASYDRIRNWLVRTLEGDGIDRLVIRHDTHAEVATMRGEEGGPFESAGSSVEELTAAIAERVFEDAIGLGGVQRYIVTAYAQDKVIARLTLRENADASGAGRQPGDPIDSEPPNEKGLLTQTMRHLEISESTHATAIANIFAMQTRMLREKDERISHLEEHHWETVVAAEQLVSDHHRRQLENRAADQKAEAMREVLGTFLQLAPTAVNKLAGRAVLPEKTSPALVGLRALVGTMKAEQLEALKSVLTPAQLETFTEIVGLEVADEEKRTTAKR
jgi:hypothetical protein